MEREDDDYLDFGGEDQELLISPAGPQEILSEDYLQAYNAIKNFLETDHGSITNKSTLKGVIGHVGPDLKTIILSNAKHWSKKNGEENRAGVFADSLGEDNVFTQTIKGHLLVANAGKNYVTLVSHVDQTMESNSRYQITFLLEGDDGGGIGTGMPAIVDHRPGKGKFYKVPLLSGQEAYESYVGVLKEAVQDLLATVQEPSKVPPAFNY